MRGEQSPQPQMFSYVDLESRVPRHHPIRKVRRIVDGTLLEACASLKSFRPRDDSDDDDSENFHGHKRRNETHRSNTDPDAKRYRKGLGKEAKLCFMGHVLTENRNGLIVEASVTEAGTKQEWLAGADRLSSQPIRPGQTVGADKGYDVGAFVAACCELGFTPHVASKARYSRLDRRTTRHAGYRVSQKKRKRVEEPFGWMKTYGLLAKLRHRGRENVDWLFRLTAAAYNITRLKGLMA